MEKERAPLIKEGVANPTDETTAQGRISARAAALIADLALLFCALLWGGSFTVVKVLLDIYPPNWLLFLRFSCGSALLLFFFHRRIGRMSRRAMAGGIVIGVALFGAILCQTLGLLFMAPGRQAFLVSTYVLFVPLLLWLFRGLFPGWHTLAATCTCLIGMALLTSDLSGPLGRGEALTVLCALFFALQIIAISRYSAQCDPISLTFVQFTVLSLLTLAAALLFERPLQFHWRRGLPELAFAIVFCTFLCYLVQICAQRYTKASHAAILMSLESVFGLLWSVIFLGEPTSLRMLFGCLLIFLSVLLVELEPLLKRGRCPGGPSARPDTASPRSPSAPPSGGPQGPGACSAASGAEGAPAAPAAPTPAAPRGRERP